MKNLKSGGTKFAIISDIHDNLINLEKCLRWCQSRRGTANSAHSNKSKDDKIKNIICCGDVTNSETLKFLSVNFDGNIYLVKGNVEIYDEDEIRQYKNIKYFGRTGRFELSGKNIGFCHELYLVEEVLEKGQCDIVFYGHTHKPWEGEARGTKIVNPGTLGGVFAKATFAAWDTENNKLELRLLDTLKSTNDIQIYKSRAANKDA